MGPIVLSRNEKLPLENKTLVFLQWIWDVALMFFDQHAEVETHSLVWMYYPSTLHTFLTNGSVSKNHLMNQVYIYLISRSIYFNILRQFSCNRSVFDKIPWLLVPCTENILYLKAKCQLSKILSEFQNEAKVFLLGPILPMSASIIFLKKFLQNNKRLKNIFRSIKDKRYLQLLWSWIKIKRKPFKFQKSISLQWALLEHFRPVCLPPPSLHDAKNAL